MSGMPRQPRDRNPARPPKRDVESREIQEQREPRSYGQSARPPTPDEKEAIQNIEDFTDEPMREGDEEQGSAGAVSAWKKRKDREFEDLAGEPVGDDPAR